MSVGTAYGLGVLTPFVALAAWAGWMWCVEEASTWWSHQRPSLGRLRCTLGGHDFFADHAWVICRRCGHAKRDKSDSFYPFKTDGTSRSETE